MKFAVDQAVSPTLADWLRAQGHDAIHVREVGMSAASDSAIVEFAARESRIIVTSDLDFARLMALSHQNGPGLILFRAGNVSDARMLELLRSVLEVVDAETLERSVVVVDGASLRVAPLPLKGDHRSDNG